MFVSTQFFPSPCHQPNTTEHANIALPCLLSGPNLERDQCQKQWNNQSRNNVLLYYVNRKQHRATAIIKSLPSLCRRGNSYRTRVKLQVLPEGSPTRTCDPSLLSSPPRARGGSYKFKRMWRILKWVFRNMYLNPWFQPRLQCCCCLVLIPIPKTQWLPVGRLFNN